MRGTQALSWLVSRQLVSVWPGARAGGHGLETRRLHLSSKLLTHILIPPVLPRERRPFDRSRLLASQHGSHGERTVAMPSLLYNWIMRSSFSDRITRTWSWTLSLLV